MQRLSPIQVNRHSSKVKRVSTITLTAMACMSPSVCTAMKQQLYYKCKYSKFNTYLENERKNMDYNIFCTQLLELQIHKEKMVDQLSLSYSSNQYHSVHYCNRWTILPTRYSQLSLIEKIIIITRALRTHSVRVLQSTFELHYCATWTTMSKTFTYTYIQASCVHEQKLHA